MYNTDNSGLALNEATHIALDEYNRRIWFTCYTGGGVTYANLQYDNSAVTTLNASKELTIRNNHVLLDLPANVSVFDTTGHLILSDYGTNIDLSNLHRGIYIVHTSNTNYRAARIIIP